MTSPSHAIDVPGKGRYYRPCSDTCPLPNDRLISVTNAQGIVHKPALVPAAVKITAQAAWDHLGHMIPLSRTGPDDNRCGSKRVADRCGRCRFCLTSAIKNAHRNEWEHKADLGTRVHWMAAAHILGEPYTPDDEAAPFITSYLAFIDAWGINIDTDYEAVETTVFDPGTKTRLGYAGTGDMWVWLTIDGKRGLWLVDIKTSLTKPANTVYGDQVLQLAGLRYAPKVLLPDDTAVDTPKFAGAAILNLRQDAHALIPIPATREAHKAFHAAVTLKSFFDWDVAVKSWVPLDLPGAEPRSRRKRQEEAA